MPKLKYTELYLIFSLLYVKKLTSFGQVLERCTQKKIGSIFCFTVHRCVHIACSEDVMMSELCTADNGDALRDAAQAPTSPVTFARQRRRPAQPDRLAVTTIDEILRRHDSSLELYYQDTLRQVAILDSWWRGSVVERRSLAGELSLSCARPAADG